MISQKKRVLVFSMVYYPRFIGGAEVAMKEITDRIPPDEIEFDMIALRLDKTLPKVERIGNITVYRIGYAREQKVSSDSVTGILHLMKYAYPFLALFKARRLYNKNPYDATWALMANYSGFGALFFKFFFPKVPFLLTLQEGDPIPYIKKRVRFVYPLFKRIFTYSNKVQAISNYLGSWAREMGARDVTVVPNGVDVKSFQPPSSSFQEIEKIRKELGYGKDDVVLVTTSRLVVKNAVGDIISALKELPENVKFLIIGTGYQEADLKLQAKSLQLEARTHFLGFVSHEKLPSYLWSSDIFIRPSLSEGFGNSFIEAMASGLPVIATPVGGIPDFLVDGKTGLFCEPEKPDTIAVSVKRIIADNSLRQRLVEGGKKCASRYDWTHVAKEMRVVFDDPVRDRGR